MNCHKEDGAEPMTNNFEEYTRVTEVLFPFANLAHIDPQILQNAATRGKIVHDCCDAITQEIGYIVSDEKINKYIESFKLWLPKQFIDKPARFFCKDLMITGECDAIYEEDGGLVLVDYKTSAKESKTWQLQGSAYAYLARKIGYNIKRIEFVKFCKNGKIPTVFVYEERFDLFLKCLELYRHFFKDKSTENYLDYL